MRKEEYRAVFKRNVGRALQALFVCAALGAAIIGCRVNGGDNNDQNGFRITKFMIEEFQGVINQGDRTIVVTLPYGTEVNEVVPTVEFVGANISPAQGTVVDFSEEPVKYTVFSKDGSAFSYMVSVDFEIPNTNEMLSFDLEGVTVLSSSIVDMDESASGVVLVKVPYGTDVSNLTAVIVHTGDSINPVPGAPQDFRNAVVYEIYSLQGEKRTYMVNVSFAPNTEAAITRLTINNNEGEINGTNITVKVPNGTDITALMPVINVSDGAIITPASGATQNFTTPVTYTVRAADNTTTTSYTVTVSESAIDDKEITSFKIAGQEKSKIEGTNITVTMPNNMPIDSLVPTIIFTGKTVTPASGVAQNFSNEVTYTVTAGDNTTKTYKVSVTHADATPVTFNSAVANGSSGTIETTVLTLTFSEDMGDALKAEHITVSGGITKGTLTNNGGGIYELAVSGIPGNEVLIEVKVAGTVYGFTITGGPKNTTVFKSPEVIAWTELTANGASGSADTTQLTFKFDKDPGLTLANIMLSGVPGVTKGTLSSSGATRTLEINGVSANNVTLVVSLDKPGFTFVQASKTVTLYKQLGAEDGLSALTVDGCTLDPVFSTSQKHYTVAVISDVIQITATAKDPKSRMVYVENDNSTVTSGEVFNSKTLNEGQNSVTIKVTAEDGVTTTSYVLTAMYSDFSLGAVVEEPIKVKTAALWNLAVEAIKTGGDNQNYIIDVTGDFDVAGTTTNTFGNLTGITVVIRGKQTIGVTNRLLYVDANQTVILRDITLKGSSGNSPVYVGGSDAMFEMRGSAKITGSTAINGGGVYITDKGTFTMRHNTSISGNQPTNGGGVFVQQGGTFIMRDNASVSDNNAHVNGGGVFISTASSTFIMRDNASVFGNTTNFSHGGGIHIESGTFRIAGGTVYGSDAADGLKNIAGLSYSANGAALNTVGTAEWGTGGTDGEPWVSNGTLSTTNDTIKVVNGVKQ